MSAWSGDGLSCGDERGDAFRGAARFPGDVHRSRRQAGDVPFEQQVATLAALKEEGLLRATEKTGAVFSPWHPMSIADGGDPDRITAALEPIAHNHGVTVPQVALAWHLHRAPNTLPIPGTTSLEHLRTNIAAAQITLDPDEVATITALVPED